MPPFARLFNGHQSNQKHKQAITIDSYGELLLITTYDHHELPAEIIAPYAPYTAWQYVYWRQRNKKNTQWKSIKGELQAQLIINYHGLKFQLRFTHQNIGFFLDMDNARHYIKERAKDKKILNLFAYSCSFSVVALQASATHITNVDMKSSFLSWGRVNHQLNHLDLQRVSFLKHNILKSLNGYIRRGPFDLIICDPPSYQPGGFKLKQDYPKILKKIHALLGPTGEALLCCNDPLISSEEFNHLISTYGTRLQIIKRLTNPPNFDTLQVVIVRCTS